MTCLILYTHLCVAHSLYEMMEEIQTTTQDGVILRGVRYINPGRPRALLIHGFTENTYMLKEHAQALHDKGYDVYLFNFRGHGNGTQESLHPNVKPSSRSNGFYGFDNIVTRDIPAMIDFVYNGTPILLVGHSLGGVSSRLFLSGIRQSFDGTIYYTKSSKELQRYLKKVNVLIANASPTTFNIDYLHYNAWTHMHESFTNFGISLSLQNRSPIAPPRGLLAKTLRRANDRINDLLHRFLLSGLYTGLINVDNLSFADSEAGRKFLRGFTTVQRDLIRDAIRWRQESKSGKGFGSRNGLVYEGLPIPEGLAFYMIGGDLDKLAPVSAMLKDLAKIGLDSDTFLIELKDYAHVDLAAGKKSAAIMTEIYTLLDSKIPAYELQNKIRSLQGLAIHRLRRKPKVCKALFAS